MRWILIEVQLLVLLVVSISSGPCWPCIQSGVQDDPSDASYNNLIARASELEGKVESVESSEEEKVEEPIEVYPKWSFNPQYHEHDSQQAKMQVQPVAHPKVSRKKKINFFTHPKEYIDEKRKDTQEWLDKQQAKRRARRQRIERFKLLEASRKARYKEAKKLAKLRAKQEKEMLKEAKKQSKKAVSSSAPSIPPPQVVGVQQHVSAPVATEERPSVGEKEEQPVPDTAVAEVEEVVEKEEVAVVEV